MIRACESLRTKLSSKISKPPKKASVVTYSWRIDEEHLQNVSLKNIKVNLTLEINQSLERSFKCGSDETFVKTEGNVTIYYNAKNMIATVEQKDPSTNNVERFGIKLKRDIYIVGKRVELPPLWEPTQSYTCKLFPVEENTDEYKAIASSFNSSMPLAEILSIQRTQNLLKLVHYYNEILNIRLGRENANEVFLYHGTRSTNPSIIVSSQEGFDARLSGNQNLWGPGIYFSDDPNYVNEFAFRSRNPETKVVSRQILIASVALGSCFNYGNLCYPALTRPPIEIKETETSFQDSSSSTMKISNTLSSMTTEILSNETTHTSPISDEDLSNNTETTNTLMNDIGNHHFFDYQTSRRYDSVSGITRGSRVYAVYNSNHCCPQYLIKYKVPEDQPSDTEFPTQQIIVQDFNEEKENKTI